MEAKNKKDKQEINNLDKKEKLEKKKDDSAEKQIIKEKEEEPVKKVQNKTEEKGVESKGKEDSTSYVKDGMELIKNYFNGKDSKKKTSVFMKFLCLLTEGSDTAVKEIKSKI